MKIISNKHSQGMENFVEQILIKFGRFLLNQVEFDANCAVDKHTKISVDRYIDRSLV